MTTQELAISVCAGPAVTLVFGSLALYVREKARTGIDERLANFDKGFDGRIQAALEAWENGFLRRLNGTYLRSQVAEERFRRTDDKSESLQREMTEVKADLRTNVRREVADVMQTMAGIARKTT